MQGKQLMFNFMGTSWDVQAVLMMSLQLQWILFDCACNSESNGVSKHTKSPITIVVCPVIAVILKWYPEHFFVYANNVNLQSCKLHSMPRFVKLISILYVWYTYSIRGVKIGLVFSNLVLLINRSIKTEIPVQRSYLMLIENYKINAVQCCLS